jgi:hypothetical protein
MIVGKLASKQLQNAPELSSPGAETHFTIMIIIFQNDKS